MALPTTTTTPAPAALFLSVTLLLTAFTAITRACSPINVPTGYGFEATMYGADVVVAGTVTDLGEGLGEGGFTQDNPTISSDVTFAVDCVYKASSGDGDGVIGANIRIDGSYKANSCSTTYLENDKSYIVSLHDQRASAAEGATAGTYSVYEPNIASKAAYLLVNADVNLDELTQLCGFEAPTAVGGSCQVPRGNAGLCRVAESQSNAAAATAATTTGALLLPAALIMARWM